MKFPENWLREHVTDRRHRAMNSPRRLTAIGLEVEDVERDRRGARRRGRRARSSPAPSIRKPTACRSARSSIGGGELLQIVCGAPNARAGPEGAAGDRRRDPARRHRRSRRPSCAASNRSACCARRRNSALDADASGLLELPADAPVGAPLAEYLGLPDASFELKLTPNRADCFGVRGVAFDVAAALRRAVDALRDSRSRPSPATRALDVRAAMPAPIARATVGRVIEGVDASAQYAAVDDRAPAPRRPAPDQPAGRRHQLRDARTRPADARLRRRQLKGPIGVRRARAGETAEAARRARGRARRRLPGDHRRRPRGRARPA